MANEEHVAILKQGVKAWNEWRNKGKPTTPVDLSMADFHSIHLSGANLNLVNLRASNLNFANLRGANLNLANLHSANLCNANLRSANLRGANLGFADLSGAILRATNLRGANLRGTDCTAAKCNYTVFGDTDLREVKGLETVVHDGPSTIGIDAIYLSGGNIPEAFLRGAGVPDTFITFMKSLTSQAFDFYSCFISHSSKDREFVERLYTDLQSNGVRCWYAPEDLKIGEPFLLGIDQGIRLHDKLLLVLSENSVSSGWVQHEVLSAMAKEQGKAPWVLFPIRLDNAVMETDIPWANMIRQSRHVGDFTQWKDHDSYRKAFDRLLRDLKGKS
jgi:hypothetical protein